MIAFFSSKNTHLNSEMKVIRHVSSHFDEEFFKLPLHGANSNSTHFCCFFVQVYSFHGYSEDALALASYLRMHRARKKPFVLTWQNKEARV